MYHYSVEYCISYIYIRFYLKTLFNCGIIYIDTTTILVLNSVYIKFTLDSIYRCLIVFIIFNNTSIELCIC